jgi:hypothetical protein
MNLRPPAPSPVPTRLATPLFAYTYAQIEKAYAIARMLTGASWFLVEPPRR